MSLLKPTAGRAVALAAALVLAMTAPASAAPSPTPLPTAKVDCVAYDTTGACSVVGVVYALAQVGDRTVIGGSFTSVSGTPRANVAAIRADGSLDPAWNPGTDGVVYALATSADGSRVFLGGGFTSVAGQPRSRLAAVTADTGQLVAGWTTQASNNLVRALVADGTDRLYVGGTFSRIGGRAVARLAAVSQATGAVDTAFVPAPGGTVRALALSDDGTDLYATGSFTTMGGAARPGIAELDAASGATTTFAPSEGGVVIAADVAPDGRLFASTTSNRTYAYDPAPGSVAPAYRVRTGGDVQAILATPDEVYIGGHFNTLPEAKLNRLALASFLPATGQPTGWDPGANGSFGVWALAHAVTATGAPALSAGGDFTRVAGLARRGYARFGFS